MRWASRRSSAIIIAAFAIGAVVGSAIAPVWKLGLMAVAQDAFGELTYRCDHAMREHMIAKQVLASTPSKENVDGLEAAELALIDCQDYDLMRKRLTLWGLTENELSLMSLKAIEQRADSLQRVVEIHEIRY